MDIRIAEQERSAADPAAEVTVDMEQVDRILNLELPVIVVLAEKSMRLEEILALGKDVVVSFEKLNNEPLSFFVNDQLLGTGKAIEVDERFSVYMNEVDSPQETLKKLANRD